MPNEILLLARVLVTIPQEKRLVYSRALMCEATIADAHRIRAGNAHPELGDGTLVARLMLENIAPLQFGDDPEFLSSLKIAADAVLQHTGR